MVDGRKGGHNSGVVGDGSISLVLGYIEVASHEDSLALDIQACKGELVQIHGSRYSKV